MVPVNRMGRRHPRRRPFAASLIADWRRRKYNDHKVRYPFLTQQ